MSNNRRHQGLAVFGIAAIVLLLSAGSLSAANYIINNVDPPGQGFNDPSPPSLPARGNPGTTLGEQRLALFERAAEIWGATLSSNVTIVIQATFVPAFHGFPLTCTPTSATLGAAGTIQIFANFGGTPVPEIPNSWYHAALANKLVGTDLTPGPPDPGFLVAPFADDIVAFFNNLLDDDPTCLGGGGWYYGFDHNEGNAVDLLAVLLHELAHGTGFSSFTDDANGQEQADGVPGSPCQFGCPSVFDHFILDKTLGLHWPQMTDAQRMASAINDPNVVWDGPNVTAAAPGVLASPNQLTVNPPATSAGNYAAQGATFGPPVPAAGLTADIVLADDGVGTVTDGCETPWVNGAAISGNIALIDRGACSFVQKVLNAQAEGAVGVVIANNLPTGLPPMGGTDPTVTIPSCGVEQSTGNGIKADLLLGNVNVTKGYDLTSLAGTNMGFVRLHAPNPVQPGSSISHWTTDTTPDLLMEPAINSGLTDDLDLTVPQHVDIGWMLVTCGDGVIEGAEVCDGANLGGETCQSQGFSGGTLACNATCDGFDTSSCLTCQSGGGDGRWNLPDLTHLGTFGGTLTSGGTGIYRIFGSLVETAPGKGILIGVIYDGASPSPYYIDGEWKISTPPQHGVFASKIFEYGTGNAVGEIKGKFRDDPLFSVVGGFAVDSWEICQ